MMLLRILALAVALTLAGCVQVPETINVNLNGGGKTYSRDDRRNPPQYPCGDDCREEDDR